MCWVLFMFLNAVSLTCNTALQISFIHQTNDGKICYWLVVLGIELRYFAMPLDNKLQYIRESISSAPVSQ